MHSFIKAIRKFDLAKLFKFEAVNIQWNVFTKITVGANKY